MATTDDQRLRRRVQGPGVIDDQRRRQQQQAAEQQRACGHHHRVVVGQPQAEDRGAGKRDGGEQDHDLGQDVGVETAERVEADDDGGSGEAEDGAGQFQERRRFVPRDAPGDQEGEYRRRRGQHHRARRRHVLLRPGDHQKRNRRIDGLLLREQLPGFGIRREPHATRVQDRRSGRRRRSANAPR